MTHLVLQALYFMLPAYIANALPVIFSNIYIGGVFEKPVDLGKKWHGERVFGDNKTVKGFFVGVVGGIVTCFVQFLFFANVYLHNLSVIDYTFVGAVIIGFLLGFGALVGDSVKSFIKRRVGIDPGAPFPVFDQLDYVIGSLIFVLIAVALPLDILLAALIVSPILPVIANIIAYFLGLKKVWW